ncbi:glycosyltransferase [Cyanobacterium aponinum UTEX 3222]|uniref:glycosyltransferase family 2 protein n=1 Tax=Cyanobacterium aponinum TaxID=379064 RepID=UPI003085AF26|nr:glycosyltransferase [Cyanobacterium aponinum UTEX 3222]
MTTNEKKSSTTIVIPTYNRCEDLERTCQKIKELDPPPDRVIICLDGCTDNSEIMLRQNFPSFDIIKNDSPQGSIASRDKAFSLVETDFILSLDDDSYPLDSDFIAKIPELFTKYPEAGVITFPEIRNNNLPASEKLSPSSPGCYVRDFPLCAAILQRKLYGTVAQYPAFFSHAYAESDYSLQLHSFGYGVWFEPSYSFRHHFTPVERNMLKRHWLNARNELWSVFMRCPFPQVFIIALLRIIRQFIFALTKGWQWVLTEPKWWWNALQGLPKCLSNRKPILWNKYKNWVMLARKPIFSREDFIKQFKS